MRKEIGSEGCRRESRYIHYMAYGFHGYCLDQDLPRQVNNAMVRQWNRDYRRGRVASEVMDAIKNDHNFNWKE